MAPLTYVYLELRQSGASLLTAMNNIRELHEPRARHTLSDKHSIEERLLKGAEKKLRISAICLAFGLSR